MGRENRRNIVMLDLFVRQAEGVSLWRDTSSNHPD
jgi:hypothetical protein